MTHAQRDISAFRIIINFRLLSLPLLIIRFWRPAFKGPNDRRSKVDAIVSEAIAYGSSVCGSRHGGVYVVSVAFGIRWKQRDGEHWRTAVTFCRYSFTVSAYETRNMPDRCRSMDVYQIVVGGGITRVRYVFFFFCRTMTIRENTLFWFFTCYRIHELKHIWSAYIFVFVISEFRERYDNDMKVF